jgi:hypothetical protein
MWQTMLGFEKSFRYNDIAEAASSGSPRFMAQQLNIAGINSLDLPLHDRLASVKMRRWTSD